MCYKYVEVKRGGILQVRNISKDKKPDNENRLKEAFTNKKHVFIIFLVVFILLSLIYLRFVWNKYHDAASLEAITLAESVGSLLHAEHVAKLSGSSSDLEKNEYILTSLSLANLAKASDSIHFAYLLGEENDNMIFLADSESPESPDFSPPGQLYTEAKDIDWQPFRTGKTVLTEPTTDRWGNWISAMVPIIDPINGRVIAVLGVDYSASEWQMQIWKKMFPDIVIVTSMLLLLVAIIGIWIQRAYLRRLEMLYYSIFHQAPIGISVVNDKGDFTPSEYGHSNSNKVYEQILGRSNQELKLTNWPDMTHPEDLQKDLEKFEQFSKREIKDYSIEKRFIRPDGSTVWTKMKISRLEGLLDDSNMHLCLLEDITASKETERSLLENQRRESVIMSHLPGMAYRCKYNQDLTMLIVSQGCQQLTGYSPESFINNKELSYLDIIKTEDKELVWEELERTVPNKLPYKCEYGIVTASNKRKWVLELGEGVYDEDGEVIALEGIIFDITDKEEIAKENEFLAYHDYITGIYNRRFFEEEFERRVKAGAFPIAIFLGDINSFKTYNDTFGHLDGDKALRSTAETIKGLIGEGDILARIGGDEFAIIVSDKNESEIKEYFDKIERASDGSLDDSPEDRLVTISWGYGIQREEEDTLDMLQQEAEAYMYNRKFYNHNSMRSKTVDVIMDTLFTKSAREKHHSERVGSLAEAIAKKMKLKRSEIDKIRVAGLLHDIGKIGIDEAVLNKPDKLNPKEWELMKLHPSKGAGILFNTIEYRDIADIVLYHHEKYDGSGYPNKLKGENIPLGSRIISVADTFDAATNERPYKRALSEEEAIKEIIESAGTHLDPKIVVFFAELMKSKEVSQI